MIMQVDKPTICWPVLIELFNCLVDFWPIYNYIHLYFSEDEDFKKPKKVKTKAPKV